MSNDNIKAWVFEQIKAMTFDVLHYLPNNEQPTHERRIADVGEDNFQDIINCGLVDDAYDLCENYGIEVPSLETS